MRRLFITVVMIMAFLSGIAQEVITELQINPQLRTYSAVQRNQLFKAQRLTLDAPVTLPFFDDFNYESIYPTPRLWVDNAAFVNTDYALFPPNVGVATLDALNDKGELHTNAIPGPQHFLADSLTSRTIRLDSIFDPFPESVKVKDSVYFSFFYQPQGRGNAPESLDSLILEFLYYSGDTVFSHIDSTEVLIDKIYNPNDTILLPCQLPNDSIWVSVNPYLKLHNSQLMLIPGDTITMPCDSIFVPEHIWQWIWSSIGESLDTNFYVQGNPLTYFRQVMIPITDSVKYYTDRFQFRFKNYVSLADNSLLSWQSNADNWNIDYVYLNINRNIGDTTYKSITFVERAPSLLEKYESMPYPQYVNDPTTAMKDTLSMIISNLDIYTHNTTYSYYLSTQNGAVIDSCPRGSWDIPPVYEDGYLDYINFAKPPVCFGFYPISFTEDSAIFTTTHILTTDPGSFENIGDTITYDQKFYNYYAYDDGTPEAGYGLTPAGSSLAYKFTLNKPDTLRAVQIYFNETLNSTNQQYFYLTVWEDENGKPGKVIHVKEWVKPQYSKSLDELHTYYLDSILPVVSTFYVGCVQTTNDNLNIGFDRYNDAHENTYFNVDGTWNQSIIPGAVMIRPVVGRQLIEYPKPPVINKSDEVIIIPNPAATNDVIIQLPVLIDDPDQSQDFQMEIYNTTGQLVYSGYYQYKFNVSPYGDGLYIVIVFNSAENNVYKGKMIIVK